MPESGKAVKYARLERDWPVASIRRLPQIVELEFQPVLIDRVRGIRFFALAVGGALVFAFVWLYRFNDPGGQYAGLTDDHFFYVVRGWQILYGDLPVRDFVDHGAPLHFYLGAAVQMVFGRGTLAEVAFSVTMLAGAAALVYMAAARASASIAAAAVAVGVHILLGARLYNYPKILVYAVAIPLLWRFIDRGDPWTRAWLAVTAVAAFLFRHDHGAFVTIAYLAALVRPDLPWRVSVNHAVRFAALALALLAPYALFIQLNGGLDQYLNDAFSWTIRERARTPVVWPGLFDNPDGASEAQLTGQLPGRAVAIVRDNFVGWMFYLELALPLLSLALLAVSRDAFRPGWSRAPSKLATVAVLGIALNAGFLRSPLSARLADPSVPHAILLAWLLVATVTLARSSASLREPLKRWRRMLAAAMVVAMAVTIFTLSAGLGGVVRGSLEKARFLDRVSLPDGTTRLQRGRPLERMRDVTRQLRNGWQPAVRLGSRDRDLTTLARYVYECTRPDDRVLVQAYIPQVLALAERAFAGGHADLRPGFFTRGEAQRLTLERLARQSVPIVLLETGDSGLAFRESFPLIVSYLDDRYSAAGTAEFGSVGVQLLAARDRTPTGIFEPLGWPCFR